MDITNLPQNLIKGLEQKNTIQLVTLSQLLNLELGKIVMATVTEITSVTPQERDALLTKTLKALLQNNTLASNTANLTPALKAEISRLLNQQSLIQSPELKWINLLVNNQSLLTYTDKPLVTGQTVPLQLLNPQKLSLVDMPKVNATDHRQQVIADTLRQLLPLKDTPTRLFAALTQLQNNSNLNVRQFLSPTVAQALKSVAEQLRSPLQLSQPKILAQVIKNSGVFFEQKLRSHLSPNNSVPLNRTYSQDLKGSLLNLLSTVNRELAGNSEPLTTAQTVKILQLVSRYIPAVGATTVNASNAKNSLPVDSLTMDISLLIQQLMAKPVKELSDKELRTQLLTLLQQHSVHNLAKIQLQQLASLHHEVNNKDGAQPQASWQLDIPIKHLNDVQQLHLHIEREWIEHKNSANESKTNTKVKQWSVTLRFDLPTLGEFCAQLAIIDTSVKATLWATQQTTVNQIRQKMENLRTQLESEGIQVKQIQCIQGTPPSRPMTLGYSLIDIST